MSNQIRQKTGAVARNWKEYIPKPPTIKHTSPLYTQFHKWDGCRKYLSDESASKTKFDLENNVIARMMSSPLRQEKLFRSLVFPKSLLLKFSLGKKDDETWLIPNIDNLKTNSAGGYAANSQKYIKKRIKHKNSFIPMEYITGITSIPNISQINWNPKNDVIINNLYIEKLIEYLEQGTSGIRGRNATAPSRNYLVINLNQGDSLEVLDGVIYINLSNFNIDNPNFDKLLSKFKEIDEEQVRVPPTKKGRKFMETFIRFIYYNK